MSIESAKLFSKRMDDDSEFEKKVNSIETVEELKAFMAQEGYDFNGKEFNEVIELSYGSELSEDELDNVTGGRIRPKGKSPIFEIVNLV